MWNKICRGIGWFSIFFWLAVQVVATFSPNEPPDIDTMAITGLILLVLTNKES